MAREEKYNFAKVCEEWGLFGVPKPNRKILNEIPTIKTADRPINLTVWTGDVFPSQPPTPRRAV